MVRRGKSQGVQDLPFFQGLQPVQLSEDASKLHDQLEAELKAQRKLRKSKRRVQQLRKDLAKEFGNARLALKANGELLVRVPQTIEYDELPARTVEYDEFAEIHPWDAQ